MLTEEDARERWCPFQVGQSSHCIASGCMAWRWMPAESWATEFKFLISSGRKIEAIKLYRGVMGAALKEAKEYVDAIEAGTRKPPESASDQTGYCGLAGRPD